MIFKQSQFKLSDFNYGDFICDEVFLSHPTIKDSYRQQQPFLNFANELHDWLLSKVIWELEGRFGGIRIQTIPVRSKNGDAFCAVRVDRKTDDRVFSDMVHRAIVSAIGSFKWFVTYYRLREKEALFEEGNFI